MAIILLIPGTALNSIIVSFYFNQWRKKQRFSACNQILLSTALTNLLHQWLSVLINLAFLVFIIWLQIKILYLCSSMLLFYTSYIFFWNTAWLSAQYCLKLGNYSSSFWAWLREKFSSSMTQVIIASFVWVWVTSLPMFWSVSLVRVNGSYSGGTAVDIPTLLLSVLLGCVLPFLLTLICIGLSVMYLLRHIRRIKQNEAKFTSSPQVSGHIQAVRTMIVHVLLNAALQVAVTCKTVRSFTTTSFTSGTGVIEIFELLILLYPSAEALIIILGNPTLKKRLLRNLENFYPKK
ncbi:taste receptor type 2 member 9-like [Dendropsophus ebraccatus]|uniref:taste receptor type 2 member 9-like n=1 Tax=Dendropsophus ebraccatus TaxID=150705 RepID=UPI00383212C7